MIFYMIRDKRTGLFYKHGGKWMPQETASVWTEKRGTAGVLTNINCDCAEVLELDTEAGLPSVAIVDGDDWQGLYFDGHLVEQGHHIRLDDIFKHLGIPLKTVYPNQEWMETRGNLPRRLDDVKT